MPNIDRIVTAVCIALVLILLALYANSWRVVHTERAVDGDRVLAGILFCKSQDGKPMVAANLWEREGYPVVVNCEKQ